jgi:hypothetical protein
MTTIAKDNDVVTLINVFTVEPEHQQRLVDVLVEATRELECSYWGVRVLGVQNRFLILPAG